MTSKSTRKKNTAARIGGLTLHAYGDSAAIAARARRGFEARFIRMALEIDPTLSGKALQRKADTLKRLHFTRMAASSARSRAKRRDSRKREA